MAFTSARIELNGKISSVVRCTSLTQLREWSSFNGHQIVKGHEVRRAISSGACVRMLDCNGRVTF